MAGASHGLFKALGAAMQGGVASPGFVLEGRFVLPGFALAAVIAWNLARRVKPAELPNR
jgi:surfactin synthase thioesterase subunit